MEKFQRLLIVSALSIQYVWKPKHALYAVQVNFQGIFVLEQAQKVNACNVLFMK